MNNDTRMACDLADAKTCAECAKPLGGYERAFYTLYRGHCISCHNRMVQVITSRDPGREDFHAD